MADGTDMKKGVCFVLLQRFSLKPSACPKGIRAGIEFKYDKRGFISPANLWEDSRVEMIGRVL